MTKDCMTIRVGVYFLSFYAEVLAFDSLKELNISFKLEDTELSNWVKIVFHCITKSCLFLLNNL